MRRRPFFFVVLAILVALSTKTFADDLVLGLSAPFTGPAAALSQGLRDGVQAAVDDINERGGVQGNQLRFIISDDQCNPANAMATAERMINVDKVIALIGYPCGATSVAVSKVARDRNLLLIVIGSGQSVPDGRVSPVLHMLAPLRQLADTVGDYVKSNFGGKRIGLWFPTPGFFARDVRGAIESRLGASLLYANFDRSTPSWLSAVDVLVAPPPLATSVDTARLSNVITPASVMSEQLASALIKNPKLFALTNPPAQDFPDATNVLARAKNAHIRTDGYFVYAYAAVEVFRDAAQKAQSMSGGALFKAATGSLNSTILGNRRFDESGNIQGLYIIGSMKSGETIASVDLCKRNDCKDFKQCPPDCPK